MKMRTIINLTEEREKRVKKTVEDRTTGIKQEMRNSMDNSAVMRRYSIKEPTIEERHQRVKESIARVNALLAELQAKTEEKAK
jgi:two-component sensor histidine kinase